MEESLKASSGRQLESAPAVTYSISSAPSVYRKAVNLNSPTPHSFAASTAALVVLIFIDKVEGFVQPCYLGIKN